MRWAASEVRVDAATIVDPGRLRARYARSCGVVGLGEFRG